SRLRQNCVPTWPGLYRGTRQESNNQPCNSPHFGSCSPDWEARAERTLCSGGERQVRPLRPDYLASQDVLTKNTLSRKFYKLSSPIPHQAQQITDTIRVTPLVIVPAQAF